MTHGHRYGNPYGNDRSCGSHQKPGYFKNRGMNQAKDTKVATPSGEKALAGLRQDLNRRVRLHPLHQLGGGA
jgi:hypothetical protein